MSTDGMLLSDKAFVTAFPFENWMLGCRVDEDYSASHEIQQHLPE